MLTEFLQSPAYAMACQQYDRVADLLDLPQGERERTKWPRRAVTVRTGQPAPIDAEDTATNAVRSDVELTFIISADRIPQPHSAVAASTGEPAPVGTEDTAEIGRAHV